MKILIVFSMLLPLISSVLYFVIFSGSSISKLIYFLTKMYTLILPLFFFLQSGDAASVLFTLSSTDLLYGISSGLLISLSTLLFFLLSKEAVNDSSSRIVSNVSRFGLDNRLRYLVFSLFLAILHSLMEEFFWRWFITTGLYAIFSVPVSILIGSAAFSAHHFVILSQYFSRTLTLVCGLGVMAGGILWSFLYLQTGSLGGPWVSHILADVTILSIGYRIVFKSPGPRS